MERKNKGKQLSREELAAIKNRVPAQKTAKAETEKIPENKKHRSFISKLKDTEIENFFERFGYLSHERLTDKQKNDYLHIVCENMEVIMNDFDIGVTFYPELTSISKFKYNEFQNFCRVLGISETKAMADIITSQLMTPRFPSYAEKRHEYQTNLISDAANNMSVGTRSVLSPLIDQQIAEANMMNNVGKYGTFDIETFFNNKYGN